MTEQMPWPTEWRRKTDTIRRLYGEGRLSEEEIMERFRIRRTQIRHILAPPQKRSA